MDFSEKIQQLRKAQGWTQEQLAEQLYVSRTAISKWESGKGYPNIDSLKNISKLFSISIDNLLSGEELIDLAADENRTNINKVYSLVFGLIDVMTLSFLFLTLYIRQDSDLIRTVCLFDHPDMSMVTWIIYLVLPVLMAVMGLVQIAGQYFLDEKQHRSGRTGSVLLQAFCILAFVASRQPSAASLLFLFFMIKVILLIKGNHTK